MHIAKKGPGVVTAADIEAPAELEILNPELEIANLADRGRLEMTLTIGRGRGYMPGRAQPRPAAHDRRDPDRLDLLARAPRRRTQVEAARVGQRTDYDKLTLDITTDGSVDPKDALGEAAEILIRQLAIFTDIEKMEGFGESAAPVGDGAGPEAALAHGMENFPIEELELGVRSYNCLKRVGIETIGDLVMKTENELAAIPNFGKKSIEEVKETLAAARAQPPRRQRRRRRPRSERHAARVAQARSSAATPAHRKALYANLACSLIEHGRIKTTEAKAKAVKPYAEQMITLGRRGDLHARRQALAYAALAGGRPQALRRRRARAWPSGRAATRGSSSSATGRATRPRWSTSSSSTTSP